MVKLAKDIMTTKLVTLKQSDAIKDAISKIEKYGVKEIPIISDSNELEGMITYYDILDYVKSSPNEKVSVMMIMPPTVSTETSLPEIAKTMIQSGVEALPVVKAGKVVGMISDYDMVKEIIKDAKIKSLKVKDIMHTVNNVILETDPISLARRIMRFNTLDRLPVVDKDNKFLGLVISIDILKFMQQPKEHIGRKDYGGGNHTNPLAMPVKSIMRTNIPEIYMDDRVDNAILKLINEELKGAPVLDKEQKVVGRLMRWNILDKIVERKFNEGVWLNFSGLPLELDTVEVLKNYLSSNIKKLKRLAPDTKSIDVHIKKLHGASEDKWNYEVNLSLTKESGNKERASTQKAHYGYNLMFTLSEALNKLIEQMDHKYQKKSDKKYYNKE